MIFVLSILYGQGCDNVNFHFLHNLIKGLDNKIIFSSVELYDLFRRLRDDIDQLDEFQNIESKLKVDWLKDKCLHKIEITTHLYSVVLTAKQY